MILCGSQCPDFSFHHDHSMTCSFVYTFVSDFVTPWNVACMAPLSKGFFRQKYWSALSFPPPGDLPDPGIEPMSVTTLAPADKFFTTSVTRKALMTSAVFN